MKNPIAKSIAGVAIAAFMAITFNLWAQDPPPAPEGQEKKWQHLAVNHDASKEWNDKELAKQINKLGKDGWEMVTVLNFAKEGTTKNTIYYFKKPL